MKKQLMLILIGGLLLSACASAAIRPAVRRWRRIMRQSLQPAPPSDRTANVG